MIHICIYATNRLWDTDRISRLQRPPLKRRAVDWVPGGWSPNLTLADYGRVARENEAAGAADAAAWVLSAVLIFSSDKLWVTRRCPCDPSTQNNAGRTPASSLL